MTVHFARSPGRVLFLAPIDYYFGVAMRDGLGAEWEPTFLGWVLDAASVPRAWDVISRRWGLRFLCIDCLQDACPVVEQIMRARQKNADALSAGFWQSTPVRQQGPRQTSSGLVLRSEERPSPTKQAAAQSLGLPWPCERDVIVRAFRAAAFTAHPDRGGSDTAMLLVLSARDVLLG